MIREVLKKDLGYSVNLIKKLKFSPDGIKVNGSWVTVRYVLCRGDVLFLDTEDKEEDISPYIIPVDLPLTAVYEDGFVTVVNKPPDMPSHPSLGHKLDTVAIALAYRYLGEPYVFRPVNRLDRDTSGCMLTANTRDASYKMYRAMVEGKIHKTYLAVLDSVPECREGVLRSYMHRRDESIIEREECGENDSDAKLAVTEYRVICDNGRECLVSASPRTGRTHQLRVHFSSRGCPITGDTLYGKASPFIGRHALHSWKTSFPHPANGGVITATAPLPADMMSLIYTLGFDKALDTIV